MDLDFERVVTALAPSLYRLAYSFCGVREDAEDAVQEVFLKYLRLDRSFSSMEEARRYLMTATANQCRDLLSSPANRRTRGFEEYETFSAAAEDTDTRLDVARALRQLEPKYRAVIYLFYYEEYSAAQIASVLGITRTAVTTRLNRARNQLKALLGGDEHESEPK